MNAEMNTLTSTSSDAPNLMILLVCCEVVRIRYFDRDWLTYVAGKPGLAAGHMANSGTVDSACCCYPAEGKPCHLVVHIDLEVGHQHFRSRWVAVMVGRRFADSLGPDPDDSQAVLQRPVVLELELQLELVAVAPRLPF